MRAHTTASTFAEPILLVAPIKPDDVMESVCLDASPVMELPQVFCLHNLLPLFFEQIFHPTFEGVTRSDIVVAT